MKTTNADCFMSDEDIQRGFDSMGLSSEGGRQAVLQVIRANQQTQQPVEVRIVRSNTTTPMEVSKGNYA